MPQVIEGDACYCKLEKPCGPWLQVDTVVRWVVLSAGWADGRHGRQGSRIVGRTINVTAINDKLALAKMTVGDIPVPPAPSSQRRRGRWWHRRASRPTAWCA